MKQTAFFLCILFVLSFGHPPTTFELFVTQLNGSFPYPIFKGGMVNRIPFVIRDMLNNYAFVTSDKLIAMHGKVIHVLMSSPDMDEIYHLHPEDFGSLSSMSAAGAYYVDAFLPMSGAWSLTASFVYQNGNDLREGKGSDYAQAVGGLTPNPNPVFDYVATKKFRGYPLPSEGFSQLVDTNNNTDSNGYEVTMTFKNGRPLNNATYDCQVFFFTVKNRDGTPCKSMVPYLDAAAHLSVVAYQDTVYHAHATFLTENGYDDMVETLKLMPSMTMDMAGNNPDMLAAMNLVMIGVQQNGTLNCLVDSAKVMMEMKMDMNAFYGPVPFGSQLVSVFDFPSIGNWRLWIYFAVNTTSGVEIVAADFAVRVAQPYRFDVPSTFSTGETSGAIAYFLSAWISLLLYIAF